MKTNIQFSLARVLGIVTLSTLVFFGAVGAAEAATLTRSLDVGMSGADVTSLQTFLAQDKTLYPQGLITGYFGFLTKSAISNFQSRNGIDPIGRVGPITRDALNLQMGGMPSGGTSGTFDPVPVISGVNVTTTNNTTTITWNTNEPAKGVVYFDTNPLTEYEQPGYVTISGNKSSSDNSLHTSQSVVLSNLQPNTAYYYDVYVTDAGGNVSMTMQTTFRTTN